MGVGGLGHILQYSGAIPGSLLRNDLGIVQGIHVVSGIQTRVIGFIVTCKVSGLPSVLPLQPSTRRPHFLVFCLNIPRCYHLVSYNNYS